MDELGGVTSLLEVIRGKTEELCWLDNVFLVLHTMLSSVVNMGSGFIMLDENNSLFFTGTAVEYVE